MKQFKKIMKHVWDSYYEACALAYYPYFNKK